MNPPVSRVLLTGGRGFIGTHVLALLRETGHEVVVLDSLRPDVHRDGPADPCARTALARDDLAAQGVQLVVGDLRERGVADGALRDVDAVVHLAAKVGLGVDVQDLPDYASSNDLATAVLLAAMARAGVGRLVQASSMVVYGEGLGRCAQHGDVRPGARAAASLDAGAFEPPCPVCGQDLGPALVGEDAPTDPRNAYAASKLAQEHLAASWARLTGGCVASLRYHNVYGPGLPRDTPYAGVAALWCSSLLAGQPPRVFEDGGQRRDFVHVRDVAAATVAALDSAGAPGAPEGHRAYNVGSGTPRTVLEVATALADAAGGPAPVVTGEYRLGDVRHITADSSRARSELGWLPRWDLESGCAELFALAARGG